MWIGTLQNIFSALLSWIFPPTTEISAIETMSSALFSASVSRDIEALPDGISSIFKYHDPLVRQALWALKYNGNQKIAKLFATLLYDHMHEMLFEAELYENFTDPIIIPLPLSRERLRERGWNQAIILSQEIIKLCPQYSLRTDILFKIKHTLPQTKLSRSKRLKNLEGCFAVDPTKKTFIAGKNIILIDDVTTTGSTILEARRTLLSAGARAVLAFTIAH